MLVKFIIIGLMVTDFYYFLKQYKDGKDFYYEIKSVFYTTLFRNPIFNDVFKRFIDVTDTPGVRNMPFVLISFIYAITIIASLISVNLALMYVGLCVFLMSFFKLIFYIEDKRNGVK